MYVFMPAALAGLVVANFTGSISLGCWGKLAHAAPPLPPRRGLAASQAESTTQPDELQAERLHNEASSPGMAIQLPQIRQWP